MGTFTIPLKRVIELTGGTTEIDPDTGISKLVGGNIGIQYYPIFDETYRDRLTGKIVDHYYNREICTESIDMFQLAMRRKMNEIMPLYNKLYESEKIVFDPLSTVDMNTLSTLESKQSVSAESVSNNESETKSGSRTVASETPQTMLSGNKDYASSAADANSTTTTDGNGTDSTSSESDTENTSESVTKGYQGVASELLMRYRQSLLNIDVMVINELSELFMQVWDTGDSYTQHGRYYL